VSAAWLNDQVDRDFVLIAEALFSHFGKPNLPESVYFAGLACLPPRGGIA
jgi:hypothetical protein